MRLITISLCCYASDTITITAAKNNIVIRGQLIISSKPKLNIISPLFFSDQLIYMCMYVTDFLFHFFFSQDLTPRILRSEIT